MFTMEGMYMYHCEFSSGGGRRGGEGAQQNPLTETVLISIHMKHDC